MSEVRAGAARFEVQRRFSDLDTQGHVNNVAYFDYLQDARIALLRDLDVKSLGRFGQVVVKNELVYRKPLQFSSAPVTLVSWIARVGTTSYTVQCEILDEVGDLAAEALTVIAVIDEDTGRPTAIEGELRRVLSQSLS